MLSYFLDFLSQVLTYSSRISNLGGSRKSSKQHGLPRVDTVSKVLKSKLRECQDTHQVCRQRSESGGWWLPSRLLDLGDGTSNTIYLRTRDEVHSELYVTLSHCWGDIQPTQLTAKTEASLRAGISVEVLHKTFRDAIMITREFSIRYLWIDSLCIFQDDMRD